MYVLRRACRCTLADLVRNTNEEIKNRAVWLQYAVVLMGFSCIETLVHAYQTRVCALPRETTVAGGRINKTERKKEGIKRQIYLQQQEPSKMGVYNIYNFFLVLIYSCDIKLKLMGLNQVAS